jgi:molecular chaperone GrpE
MSKRRRIELPSEDEIARFGASAGGTGPSEPSSPPPASAKDEAASEGASGRTEERDARTDELESLRRELEEREDKLLRAKAECQNLLRRSANERAEAIRFANEAFIKSLLPVVDDFERTLEAGQQANNTQALMEGVKLVYEKMIKVLRDAHVAPIEALGLPFDPTYHSAILQERSEEHAPGTVLRQIQKGYSLRDRVLRPAQVVVAASPTTADADQTDPAGDPNQARGEEDSGA